MVRLRQKRPYIRILAVPPGEAPEEVRAAWVGLLLPLASGRADVYQSPAQGVLTGVAHPEPAIGYFVEALEAIEVLRDQSPHAAEWWIRHTPHLLMPDRCLIFHEYLCERVEMDE